MKNCIFFKFLAILLCAASLMGVIGGTAGALVLVEGNLYNRTVDQMLNEKFQTNAAFFADQIALAYASQELGSCPQDMVQRYQQTLPGHYGYAITDAEGNVLTVSNPELKNSGEVYRFPVAGQYMHLVSTETETEKLARETTARMDAIRRNLEDKNGQTVPGEGIPVNQVIFTDHQGTPIYEAYGDQASCSSIFYYEDRGNVRGNSSYDHEPRHQIGFLYHGAAGQILYRSFLEEWDHNFTSAEVYGVMFLSHENGFLFQLDDPDGLGILTFENGHLCFSSYAPEEPPAETQPQETVPATTAETVPETAPQETAEETQPAEETHEEAPAEEAQEVSEETHREDAAEEAQEDSSASAVPEEEYAEEYTAQEHSEEDSREADEESLAETQPPATESPETVPAETLPPETVPEETAPVETDSALINGKPLEAYQVNRTEYVDSTTGEHTTAKYVYLPLPELTVEVFLDRDTMGNAELYDILRMVRQYRSCLLPVIGICLLVFTLSIAYLFTAAGHKPKTEEVRAGGFNRLPLDLYLTLGSLISAVITALAVMGVPVLLSSDFLLGCSFAVFSAFVCCLLFTGFCFAFVAQVKTGNGYWWRNTLSVRFVRLTLKLANRVRLWLAETCLPWLSHIVQRIWRKIQKILMRLYGIFKKAAAVTGTKLNHFFSLIPLTWQWVVCGMLLFCLLLIACNTHSELLTLICLVISLGLIFYGSHCFGILLATARKMGKGDLDTKITSKIMIGSFRDFAKDLNDLADVSMTAAQKQLKSERMKTELITNVSHDIKTPLTSIINYVDLLQKPHTPEEGEQYLEVLDRQSQRLKKLVEDLMDMSKASTGNMAVEITRVDAVESVNQALGEFSEKLERAHLYPVFRHAEESVPMMADGKLVWRVLSNLLGNVVKYGMPGTRIYLDLTHVNRKVIISLKNISREELNVTAEELMERFVRGDVSRNTEGSGLGLNIAKSLMELQKGSLQILIDGDLFKVTLIFPDAQ